MPMTPTNCVTLALLGLGLVSGPVAALILLFIWWPLQDRKETLRRALEEAPPQSRQGGGVEHRGAGRLSGQHQH